MYLPTPTFHPGVTPDPSDTLFNTGVIETDWPTFLEMGHPDNAKAFEDKVHRGLAYEARRRCAMNARDHILNSPMEDFSDLDGLVADVVAELPTELKDRPKRKTVNDWAGGDLDLNPVIDRQGIPFQARKKKNTPRPVIVLAQRLAAVSTSGGSHKWNGVGGIVLYEILTKMGYEVEFYAYSDHVGNDYAKNVKETAMSRSLFGKTLLQPYKSTRTKNTDQVGRCLTLVKLCEAGKPLYADTIRRALCDSKVYTKSWWLYRLLLSDASHPLSTDTAYGFYSHKTEWETMDLFPSLSGKSVVKLDLVLTKEDCLEQIKAVLAGDPEKLRRA